MRRDRQHHKLVPEPSTFYLDSDRQSCCARRNGNRLRASSSSSRRATAAGAAHRQPAGRSTGRRIPSHQTQTAVTAPRAVSVVIPTWQRPQLVSRAVRSVLEQTFTDFEIVVVVDGRDADTTDALRDLRDDRVACTSPSGTSETRTPAIAAARWPARHTWHSWTTTTCGFQRNSSGRWSACRGHADPGRSWPAASSLGASPAP